MMFEKKNLNILVLGNLVVLTKVTTCHIRVWQKTGTIERQSNVPENHGAQFLPKVLKMPAEKMPITT